MNYKRILKSRDLRMKILKMLRFVPDSVMLKLQYRIKCGRKLDLRSPIRYTEKLQWYKINYRNPIMRKCADKGTVREYVADCGLENILNECFGVYDDINQINFEDLPNSFVMKDTMGGGGLSVKVVENKAEADYEELTAIASKWLKRVDTEKNSGREWAYGPGKHRVIIEEFLKDNESGELPDYKFMCFNGVVKYVVYDCERFIDHKRAIYDRDWNYIDVETDCKEKENSVPKPEGFEKMRTIAETLSKEFPYVRVDLYWANGKVYFGEMTFYPWSGYVQFTPDEFDFTLGKEFEIEIGAFVTISVTESFIIDANSLEEAKEKAIAEFRNYLDDCYSYADFDDVEYGYCAERKLKPLKDGVYL